MRTSTRSPVNPAYARRIAGAKSSARSPTEVRIGNATLYLGDSFELLPKLPVVDAVITDPPFWFGYGERFLEETAEQGDDLMELLVPMLIRVTNDGPCFVWQSPLRVDRWHEYFPKEVPRDSGLQSASRSTARAYPPKLGPSHILERKNHAR